MVTIITDGEKALCIDFAATVYQSWTNLQERFIQRSYLNLALTLERRISSQDHDRQRHGAPYVSHLLRIKHLGRVLRPMGEGVTT
jgi:hypothetical protein